MKEQTVVMEGVREYAEGFDVALMRTDEGRIVIQAENEGGCNCTRVDLVDLLKWLTEQVVFVPDR